MCMCVLMELELILTGVPLFELGSFWQLLNCGVRSLCNQLLQFSTDVSQTWQTYCGHIEDVEDVHVSL